MFGLENGKEEISFGGIETGTVVLECVKHGWLGWCCEVQGRLARDAEKGMESPG